MSRKFWFTYFPYPQVDSITGKTSDIFRPTVPVQISLGSKITSPFQALVDSGSDRNLFPASLGELIGIDIKSVKLRPIIGIGKAKLIAYTHSATLHIERCNFEVEIDFSYEQEVPILGRNGFFNCFKRIDFSEKKRIISFKT